MVLSIPFVMVVMALSIVSLEVVTFIPLVINVCYYILFCAHNIPPVMVPDLNPSCETFYYIHGILDHNPSCETFYYIHNFNVVLHSLKEVEEGHGVDHQVDYP